MNQRIVGGLILLIQAQISSGQGILNESNAAALSIIEKQNKWKEDRYKGFLEKFLKCDGKNGNVEMDMDYADPNFFYIENGKCKYVTGWGN